MRFYLEGDKSAAICHVCKRKVTTRMERRAYQPEGFGAPVPDVLVGVCETCDAVLTIPIQSLARINALRKPPRNSTKVFKVRVSGELGRCCT